MEVIKTRLVVISHAGVKRINRSVYSLLKNHVGDLKLIVPARLLLKSGVEVYPDQSEPGDAQVVPMVLKGSNPRKYFYPCLPEWLDENKPGVILLENDPASYLGMRLASWCRRNGAKIICQTYDNTPRSMTDSNLSQGFKAIPKNLLIHVLNHRMASKIDALLVVNDDSARLFGRYGYRNILQIPLGYDPAVFFVDKVNRDRYRTKLGVAKSTVLLAYFGRLVKQKGVHILIQALSGLSEQNWMLLLDHNHDSEDEYSLYIRNLIESLGLTHRVIYFEADHYEIAGYMQATDVMVAPSVTTPSFKEQYGRAVQEAMACGAVCVVSDSGHPKDLVGDAGLVFKEGETVMLTRLLSTLINDAEARQKYSEYLSRRAASLFTTDYQATQLLEIISNLINLKR